MIQQLQKGEIGRNDPCPCGSGRKFKVCCLRAAAVGAAKVAAATSRLAQIFEVGEGIIVKGVAFKIRKIVGDRMVVQDLNMSDEDIAELSCNKETVKEKSSETV